MKKKKRANKVNINFVEGEHVLVLVRCIDIKEYDDLRKQADNVGARLTYAVCLTEQDDLKSFSRVIDI